MKACRKLGLICLIIVLFHGYTEGLVESDTCYHEITSSDTSPYNNNDGMHMVRSGKN